jgi:putative salt-induced outer membrane protein YdiY
VFVSVLILSVHSEERSSYIDEDYDAIERNNLSKSEHKFVWQLIKEATTVEPLLVAIGVYHLVIENQASRVDDINRWFSLHMLQRRNRR